MDAQLQRAAHMMPVLDLTDAVAAREATQVFAQFVGDAAMPPSVVTTERTIPGPAGAPGLRARIYQLRNRTGPAPGLVFFHPGGFVLGDLETDHVRCLRYTAEVGCVIVTTEFRLAPEHPFPAGIEDSYATLCWTRDNAATLGIDPARIAVAGCSTGATFAAAVALMARDRGGPPLAFQLLLYPALDDRLDSRSMRQYADIPGGDRTGAELMWHHYLGSLEHTDEVPAYAAPARATDLSALPPAYVMTNEIDVCRDEGLEYTRRLIAADVPVELHEFSGTFHAFEAMVRGADISRRAQEEHVAVLRRALRRGSVPQHAESVPVGGAV